VARFNDGVDDIKDLVEGMVLEGTVSNVAQFGAFVDLGVHQDGLVHVSELAHRFVKDPAEVVKVGERVKVKVLKVDAERRRIGLSIKQASAPPTAVAPAPRKPDGPRPPQKGPPPQKAKPPEKTPFNNPFAAAFRDKK
jgi:uncharacterized protein